MAQPAVVWTRPPSELARDIDRFAERLLVAIHGVGAYVGQKMQDEARPAARWHDRTGNARSGLFFAVDGFGAGTVVGEIRPKDPATFERDRARGPIISGSRDRLVIVLGHTMYYGKWLELSPHYGIVMSTLESNLPVLEGMLTNLFDQVNRSYFRRF